MNARTVKRLIVRHKDASQHLLDQLRAIDEADPQSTQDVIDADVAGRVLESVKALRIGGISLEPPIGAKWSARLFRWCADRETSPAQQHLYDALMKFYAPCSPLCPAVTGEAHNGVQYCPMADMRALSRHRGCTDAPEVQRLPPREHVLTTPPERLTALLKSLGLVPVHIAQARGKWPWYAWDWRARRWAPGTWAPTGEGVGDQAMVTFEPKIPLHPDYTDCCADFRCCSDRWSAAGLGAVRDALAAGAPTVAIAQTDAGPVVLHAAPTKLEEEI